MSRYAVKRFPSISRKKQSGVILVFTLVLLILMTVGGIGALRSASFDNRVSATVGSRIKTLEEAEWTLLNGESALCQHLSETATCSGNILFDFGAVDTDGWYVDYQIKNIANIEAFLAKNLETIDSEHKYSVEFLGGMAASGGSLGVGGGHTNNLRHVFRITAIGVSETGGQTVVQSYFAARY